jgi:hypothetical protein
MSTGRHEPIHVTGAAGQLGAVGRTVTGLLLDRSPTDRPTWWRFRAKLPIRPSPTG